MTNSVPSDICASRDHGELLIFKEKPLANSFLNTIEMTHGKPVSRTVRPLLQLRSMGKSSHQPHKSFASSRQYLPFLEH